MSYHPSTASPVARQPRCWRRRDGNLARPVRAAGDHFALDPVTSVWFSALESGNVAHDGKLARSQNHHLL